MSYRCHSLRCMTVAELGEVPEFGGVAELGRAPELGGGSEIDGVAAREPVLPSLSPSRAADFKTCPLLYRFRTIDRLPEQPTRDQARGTLVHAVLERLFDLPPVERTHAAAT